MINRLIIPLLAAAALAYAAFATKSMQPERKEMVPPFEPPKKIGRSSIAGTGIVEPSSELIGISPAVSGLCMEVFVTASRKVRFGEQLARLDGRELSAELDVKKAVLATAEAELARLDALPRPEDVPPYRSRLAAAESILLDATEQLKFIESVADPRAVRADEIARRRRAVELAKTRVDEAKTDLDRILSGAWTADKATAAAKVAEAAAAVKLIEIDLDRLTVKAPCDAVVLKVDIRPGEYAAVGAAPLMTLGVLDPLHVRVDVDENDASIISAGAPAIGYARGAAETSFSLKFVRFEPHVVPKRSLTGQGSEFVDVRVLQAIYRVEENVPQLFTGRQVDVFIEREARP